MTSERAPAFQFYPKDFLTDAHVLPMTLTERGAYITLLCVCWLERSLPSDQSSLAKLCRITLPQFRKLWPALAPCFELRADRLTQGRLDRERRKQSAFRAQKVAAGQLGGKTRVIGKQRLTSVQAESSSSIFSLPSSISSLQSAEKTAPTARSKRPIFTGQRFTVFEWQLEDLMRMLGRHTDAFDLHAWFFDLDAQAANSHQVIPLRDGGRWLQAQTLAEAKRRGLAIADGVPVKPTAEQDAADILAEIQRQDRAVQR